MTCPIVAFIIKYPTKAAKAATPSPPANPSAVPTANSNGKLSKTICPAASITEEIMTKTSIFNQGASATNCSLCIALPNASKIPAAGKIATGNIKALPIRCNCPKSFLNII